MEVYERVNEIMQKKKITKTDFVNILIETEVKLKTTGETPSKSTVYAYLNGTREIPLELITIIANILNIKVQDLFENSTMHSCEIDEFLELVKYAPHTFLTIINNILYEYKNLFEKNVKKLNSKK